MRLCIKDSEKGTKALLNREHMTKPDSWAIKWGEKEAVEDNHVILFLYLSNHHR